MDTSLSNVEKREVEVVALVIRTICGTGLVVTGSSDTMQSRDMRCLPIAVDREGLRDEVTPYVSYLFCPSSFPNEVVLQIVQATHSHIPRLTVS